MTARTIKYVEDIHFIKPTGIIGLGYGDMIYSWLRNVSVVLCCEDSIRNRPERCQRSIINLKFDLFQDNHDGIGDI